MTGARRRLRAAGRNLPLIAVGSALLAGVLINWGQSAFGYNAGNNDHSVLSPLGLQWADPTRFVGDWFLDAAPQPHWLFDVVTFLGASAGALAITYVLFWAIGLAAFGLATAVVAVRVLPRAPWAAALGFTLVITQTPWNVVGSGSTMIAEALPTVVAGNITYLFLACLLTGRFRSAAGAAVAVALVHVQQGAVAVVILLAVGLVRIVAERRVPVALVVGAVGTAAVVGFGLVLRPVAANLTDFIEVCDTVIPYHCAAHSWPPLRLIAFTGFIGLALLSIRLWGRRHRWVWTASVGLSAVGLFGGMASDAFRIPLLGDLAQATNVYRLGVVLLPFVVWGILSVLIRPPAGRFAWMLLVAWAGLTGAYFLLEGWPTGGRVANGILLVALVLLAALALPRIRRAIAPLGDRGAVIAGSTALAGVAFLVAAVVYGGVVVRGFHPEFITNPSIRAWGAEVERVVPSGETLLTAPLAHTVRLATGRADVVDCKNVPYGGEAWREWRERIDRLGGFGQCLNPAAATFADMSAAQLVSVAEDYGARYMVIDPAQYERIRPGLDDRGWGVILEPADGIQAVVLGDSTTGWRG